jgi:hypothetical protein
VTSCVQKITFVLFPAISDGIVTPVSNQCPQGPPIREFSHLNGRGPSGPQENKGFYESLNSQDCHDSYLHLRIGISQAFPDMLHGVEFSARLGQSSKTKPVER